jgi:hypothetical protein
LTLGSTIYIGLDGMEPIVWILIGVFALVAFRLACELAILPFQIYEVLVEIRESRVKPDGNPPWN